MNAALTRLGLEVTIPGLAGAALATATGPAVAFLCPGMIVLHSAASLDRVRRPDTR